MTTGSWIQWAIIVGFFLGLLNVWWLRRRYRHEHEPITPNPAPIGWCSRCSFAPANTKLCNPCLHELCEGEPRRDKGWGNTGE